MARLAVSKARSSGTAFSAPPIALNKYDLSVLSDYGGRLVSVGQVARGMAMLEAGETGVLRQSSHQFSLFLGHYLLGDLAAATQNAGQITNDAFPLGLLARALAAAANGARKGDRRARPAGGAAAGVAARHPRRVAQILSRARDPGAARPRSGGGWAVGLRCNPPFRVLNPAVVDARKLLILPSFNSKSPPPSRLFSYLSPPAGPNPCGTTRDLDALPFGGAINA